MFRNIRYELMSGKPIPHPSGDVPTSRPDTENLQNYSPPKWGCSAGNKNDVTYCNLFPTQVGMFRGFAMITLSPEAIPHPSGDVPLTENVTNLREDYSPPKWGCSDRRRFARAAC